MAKKALGRGLGALIPQGPPADPNSELLSGSSEIPIDLIIPNNAQPRKSFRQEELEGLAESIKSVGIIEPLVLNKDGDKYIIIAGERRYRASKLAGLKSVPAIIKDVSENEVLEMALIENIQREDLNPIEEANAYHELIENLQLKQEELAKRIGKSRVAVTNALRLLNLPDEVQQLLIEGSLSAGHARALLMVKKKSQMKVLADKAVNSGLSVRELEALSSKLSERAAKKDKADTASKDPDIEDLESRLQEKLGTRVNIKHGKKGGRIEITYYDSDDLERILEVIGEE